MAFYSCPALSGSGSLWQQAAALSGVPVEQATDIDEAVPLLFERLGAEAIRRLSTCFYERVYADTQPLPSGVLLRAAFANTTKADAIGNQALFLIERLGGPKGYTARKGALSLIGRHAPYAGVTREGAERWVKHMEAAMASVPELDEDSSRRLRSFFRFHAHYIVEGRTLLNPHRLLSYGGIHR